MPVPPPVTSATLPARMPSRKIIAVPSSQAPGVRRGDDLPGGRQRLTLLLEAGDHLPAFHSQLDDLERDPAADRLLLFRHEDGAEPALPDQLQELVLVDLGARPFEEDVRERSRHPGGQRGIEPPAPPETGPEPPGRPALPSPDRPWLTVYLPDQVSLPT